MKSQLDDILGLPPKQPLLPRRKETDRPLWVVLAIMAFLATLALLAGRQGLRLGTQWQSELYGTASLQIFDVAPENKEIIIERVTNRLNDFRPPLIITPLSQADMFARIKPWLGDSGQSEDLPFPIFFALKSQQDIRPDQVKRWLEPLNLTLLIDDHAASRKEFQTVGRALYRTAMLILILVLAASAVIAGYATQSVMSAFAPTLKVIYRSGASRAFVAQLFVKRIFKLSCRGALIGVLGGLIVALLWNGLILGAKGSLMQRLSLHPADIIWIIILVLFFIGCCTVVSGITAWRAPQTKQNIP